MEIKAQTKPRSWLAVVFVLLSGSLLAMVGVWRPNMPHPPLVENGELMFQCGMEKRIEKDGRLEFDQPGYEILGAESQREKVSFSGKYASMVDQDNRFGAACHLQVNGGQRVLARIWRLSRHGNGSLVTHGQWGHYYHEQDAIWTDPSGWELLQVEVSIPDSVDQSMLNIYVWYPSEWKGEAYFDDLEVWKLNGKAPGCDSLQQQSLWNQPHNGVHIHPHIQSQTPAQTEIRIFNFHPNQIEIIGGTPTLGDPCQPLPQSLWIDPLSSDTGGLPVSVLMGPNVQYICYRLAGDPATHHEPLIKHPAPTSQTPRQRLFGNIQVVESPWYRVQDSTIQFVGGKHRIEQDLLIPKGYNVVMPAGTQLDFANGARFISFSPVQMKGTEDHPILITSSDSSAQGFSVLGGGVCRWDFVHVSGFNTLDADGWMLTSAVTFYECQVTLNHVSVVHNHCEDALNLVRSRFEIDALEIAWTYADGFDADFCEGTVQNSWFHDTGNDGMDFSGSHITVKDCRINRPGDKGISVGEHAYVKVAGGVEVTDAPIGMAAKDLSELTVEGAILQRCKVGFAAYQKKPEFGPGFIFAKAVEMKGNEQNYRLGNGSQLQMDGQLIQ